MMASNKITGLPIVEEHEATGEVARIFAEIKRELQIPTIPNSVKSVAASPGMLTLYWTFYRTFLRTATFPESLVSMIFYTIAETNHCQYCSATNELTCRQLGIDENTLKALVDDLGNVSPERLRAIITFARKASSDPQALVPADYDEVRAQGVTDEELIELIVIAGIGKLFDTLADSFKVEVDPEVVRALSGDPLP